MTRRITAVLLTLSGVMPGYVGAGVLESRPSCVTTVVALDTSLANDELGTFSGRAIGQTFRAVDTLITRVTVWRPANDIDAVGTHLFITTVDTSYVPAKPITQGIVQDGPTVLVRGNDVPGPLIRLDFILDPPCALPHPGIFAFFLQREHCDPGESRFVSSNANPYPDGISWISGSVAFLPCYLRSVDGGGDLWDVIFEIEFCHDITTPVRPTTWGRLKILYR